MKILLVEDSEELALWLARALTDSGFVVERAPSGEAAAALLAGAAYQVVLLDLKLPDMDGRSLLRRLRRQHDDVPVLVLTASGSLDIKIDSLEQGADDYLVKPFEVGELVARIRALIRRHGRSRHSQLHCADLQYDLDSRQFSLGLATLALTPREHAVLEALLLGQGRTLSKTQLVQAVFGLDDTADEAAIEIYVHRLRRKLEGSGVAIVTLRGLGYLLRERGAQP